MYVCVCVCVCVYMYVCMYVCIFMTFYAAAFQVRVKLHMCKIANSVGTRGVIHTMIPGADAIYYDTWCGR